MARAAVALLGVAVSCATTGSVELVIDLPEEPSLSPVDDRLARLTLIVEADGESARVTNRDVEAAPMRGTTLAFGDVPVAPGVRIELLASSLSGRLLGFGRADVGEVGEGDQITVPVKLRRPFAYVAGGESPWAYDAAVEPGESYARALALPSGPLALATTPDGGAVVVVSGTQLMMVSTSNHQPVGGVADVGAGAIDVAVSPDGRWAAAARAEGISLVDLDALRAGDTTASFHEVTGVAAVAVGSEIAYVLTDGATAESCSEPSTIFPVTLSPTPSPGAPFALASGARALAVVPSGPRAGSLVAALPCQNALVIAAPDGSGQIALLNVPNPAGVAVAGSRVWGIGWDGAPSDRYLVLASVEIDGSGATRLNLAPSQALAQSNDLTEEGQTTETRLGADQLDPYRLAVLPGERSAALLLHGRFHADPVVRTVIIGGTPISQVILPRIDMETHEYLLVDVTAGAVSQRMRTRCTVDWEREVAVIDDWSCASSPGQDTSTETFTPVHQAVLYGGN